MNLDEFLTSGKAELILHKCQSKGQDSFIQDIKNLIEQHKEVNRSEIPSNIIMSQNLIDMLKSNGVVINTTSSESNNKKLENGIFFTQPGKWVPPNTHGLDNSINLLK
tara:strand:- start:188 stop:511 length:324 start_codon:yes stop_codon:yes gene_type:complete